MKKVLALVMLGVAMISCARKDRGVKEEYRAFPTVEVPAVITEAQERMSYMLGHFWDGFFAGTGVTDTSAVLGVKKSELEKALASFIELGKRLPKAQAQEASGRLFASIEKAQSSDTSSHVYLLMTELVSKYLYDPNSPYRDEDVYLPFVRGLANSQFTKEEVRPGYAFELEMCSLNQYGTVAADFGIKDRNGRKYTLHGIRADFILLFFSNPGCDACKEIVLALKKSPWLDGLIESGRVKVVNVYIDRELDKWREYEHNYPDSWISGYDYNYIIREDAIYNVRAIPSLYVLDSEKRVLMKDATTGDVLEFIKNIK